MDENDTLFEKMFLKGYRYKYVFWVILVAWTFLSMPQIHPSNVIYLFGSWILLLGIAGFFEGYDCKTKWYQEGYNAYPDDKTYCVFKKYLKASGTDFCKSRSMKMKLYCEGWKRAQAISQLKVANDEKNKEKKQLCERANEAFESRND